MWAADTASRRLGIELEEVGDDRARVRMVVADWMSNGHGICHGGLVFTLADTAFAPARAGDVLVSETEARRRFGRSGIYYVTVRREGGTVIAEFRGHRRMRPG